MGLVVVMCQILTVSKWQLACNSISAFHDWLPWHQTTSQSVDLSFSNSRRGPDIEAHQRDTCTLGAVLTVLRREALLHVTKLKLHYQDLMKKWISENRK